MACRLTFALMTNTLILSSLISLMSMSLEGVSKHGLTEVRDDRLIRVFVIGDAPCPRRIPFSVSLQDPLVHWLWTLSHESVYLTDKPIRLAIYVLESSNSRRLTYFMPPLVS